MAYGGPQGNPRGFGGQNQSTLFGGRGGQRNPTVRLILQRRAGMPAGQDPRAGAPGGSQLAQYQPPPATGLNPHQPAGRFPWPGHLDPRVGSQFQSGTGHADPGAGSQFQDPGANNPQPESQFQVPGAPQRPGGGKGKGATPPTPYDAEYYSNVANYLFKTNNAISAAGQQAADERTALQAALGQLRYAQPRANLAAEERANQEGALYSTAYGQSLGDLNNQYLTKESGLTGSSSAKLAALAQRIAALRGSVPLYENSQGYQSALRLAQAAAKNPALGEPTGPLTARGALSLVFGRGGVANPVRSGGRR